MPVVVDRRIEAGDVVLRLLGRAGKPATSEYDSAVEPARTHIGCMHAKTWPRTLLQRMQGLTAHKYQQ